MKVRLCKEAKKAARSFAAAYYEIKSATDAYDRWQRMNRDVDLERQKEYELRIRHLNTIEETFIHAVDPDMQKRVWNYFYKKVKIEAYEKAELDAEINKWIESIAKELGITTDF
jgi:hypothetical protein